jgi:hypothetical protein
MKLYTEEQVNQIIDRAYDLELGTDEQMTGYLMMNITPIDLQSGLDKLKKLIEDRPTEFSQYNAYFYLYIIDLIKNGKEVPEQRELIKMIRENK